MPYCGQCGSQFQENAEYCPVCGVSLAQAGQTPQPGGQPPPYGPYDQAPPPDKKGPSPMVLIVIAVAALLLIIGIVITIWATNNRPGNATPSVWTPITREGEVSVSVSVPAPQPSSVSVDPYYDYPLAQTLMRTLEGEKKVCFIGNFSTRPEDIENLQMYCDENGLELLEYSVSDTDMAIDSIQKALDDGADVIYIQNDAYELLNAMDDNEALQAVEDAGVRLLPFSW